MTTREEALTMARTYEGECEQDTKDVRAVYAAFAEQCEEIERLRANAALVWHHASGYCGDALDGLDGERRCAATIRDLVGEPDGEAEKAALQPRVAHCDECRVGCPTAPGCRNSRCACHGRERFTAEELIAAGYAVVSRKYGMVSRIDREDWKEYSQRKGLPVDAGYYRRCVSRDKLEVPERVWRRMPNSGDAGYAFRRL